MPSRTFTPAFRNLHDAFAGVTRVYVNRADDDVSEHQR